MKFNKKQKQWLGIIIGIILIGIILSQTGLLKNLALAGFSSMSISKVDIGGESYIRVYGTAQGSEGLSVTLSQSELDKELSKYGLKSTKPIPITIKLEKQIAKYSIVKSNSEIFYNVQYRDMGRLTSCSISSCQTQLGSNFKIIGTSRSPTLVCMCVYAEQEGITGTFIGDKSIDYDVSIDVDGNIAHLTRDENVLSLKGGDIKVEGLGSLNNFDELNAPTSWKALFTNSRYTKLISTSAYNSQETNFNTFKSCMGYNSNVNLRSAILSPLQTILDSLKSVDTVKSCVDTYRNKVNVYLSDKTDEYKNSKVSYYADSDDIYFSGDNLVINLKVPSTFPTFTITMKADSVGIIELIGEPKCENPEDKNVKSGSTLTEYIKVTNIGKSAGTFYGSVSCDNNVNGIISESYFESGETKNMRISISASNEESGIKYSNCNYKITDRKSQESVTCSNKIGVEYQSGIICTPNSYSCDSENLMKCSNDGTKKELFETCQYGCSNNFCIGKEKPNETSSDCKSCSQWLMNIFKSKEKECSSTSAFKPEVKWYNPFSWTKWTSVKLLDLTGLTSQNYICPLFFLLMFIFVMILILIMAMVGIPVSIFFLIFVKIFKNIKSGFKKVKRRK